MALMDTSFLTKYNKQDLCSYRYLRYLKKYVYLLPCKIEQTNVDSNGIHYEHHVKLYDVCYAEFLLVCQLLSNTNDNCRPIFFKCIICQLSYFILCVIWYVDKFVRFWWACLFPPKSPILNDIFSIYFFYIGFTEECIDIHFRVIDIPIHIFCMSTLNFYNLFCIYDLHQAELVRRRSSPPHKC